MRGLTGLKTRKGLKGLGPSQTRLPALPRPLGIELRVDEDPLVYEIWQVMGGRERDLKLARQCATLKRERLPDATTPELIVYIWLSERGYDFEFQVEVNGGRRDVGGSVVDFVVRAGKEWAIRVQGNYWHDQVEQGGLDELRKRLLVGAFVGKYQIDGVVDLWEDDLYRDRETVMTMALAGFQLPH